MLEKEILKLPDFQKKIIEMKKKDSKSSNKFFKNEEELYEYVEKLPTFKKILIVQNLLKEMMSIKDRFEENKEKMIEKIDSNSFKYFKNLILLKEKYDFILSVNPSVPLNYTLLKNTNDILCSFEEDNKVFIENFFFELRNNNSLMLKIIENIESKYYDQLSNFIVHFLYKNTRNSSSAQDELMLITYLILENILNKNFRNSLTQKNIEKDIESEINQNKLFLYNYLKNFTRKPEIRNYICTILYDNILKLENEKKVLYLDIRTIHKSIVDEENENEKILNKLKKKKSSVLDIEKILKGSIMEQKSIFKSDSEDIFLYEDKSSRRSMGYIATSNKSISINNNILDSFFKDTDITQLRLSKLLAPLNSKNRSPLENAYMEYLMNLKKEFHQNDKNEIYSNVVISEAFKGTKINKEKITVKEIGNIFKDNYNIIINFMEEIFQKLNDNINSLPFSIKCMYYMLSQLLEKLFTEKAQISLFQKIMIKLRFIFNGFIIPTLSNPLYNGIISDNVISKGTKENTYIISKILEKIMSGNLFNIMKITMEEQPYFIIFNKYIVDKMPFLFEMITNIDNYIENNFEPPLFITNLLSSNNKKNNNNRNIDYDYFSVHYDENIWYQCICFSSSDLVMFISVLNSVLYKVKNKSNTNLLIKYRKIFEERYQKNKNENKEEYFLVSKFSYKESFSKEIKSVTEDFFENYFNIQKNNNNNLSNNEIPQIKKCLIELLMFINKLHKNNFNIFIKRNDEIFIHHNSISNILFNYKKLNLYNQAFEGEKKNLISSVKDIFHKKKEDQKDISEDNLEDADFLKEIFPGLLSNIKYEIGYNFDNLKLEHIIFCASYLQIHIKYLPIDYVKNNYSKLFMDIMKDVEMLIKSLQNNILNRFYLKKRKGDKLNLIMSNYTYKIKNIEKYFCIDYLFNKLKLSDPFDSDFKSKSQTMAVTDISSYVTLDNCSIPTFIKKFPDFRKNEREIDDIIEEENSKNIPNLLKKYFNDIKNLIKDETIISKFSKEEYLSICYELENYILFRLYEKIFPTIESSKDNFIYKKCNRLSFIKPENYLKDTKAINENLLKTAMEYINDMDKKFTPVDKIQMFGKAFQILQNFMAFSSGKNEFGIDDTLPLLIYVVLKAKPKMINTNYNYCKYYINPELDKKEFGILLMQIGMVIKVISEMKHTDLIGVTEEQFGQDKEIPPKIRRSKNLEGIY